MDRKEGSLVKCISAYGRKIGFLVFLSLCVSGLSLCFVYGVRYAVDAAGAGYVRRTTFFIVLTVILLAVRVVAGTAYRYSGDKTKAALARDLRKTAFSELFSLNTSSFREKRGGDIMEKLSKDVDMVASDTVRLLPAVAGSVFRLVGTIVLLFLLDARFAGVFLIGSAFTVLSVCLLRNRLKSYARIVREKDGASYGFMLDSFRAFRTVKAYRAEELVKERSSCLLEECYRAQVKKSARLAAMRALWFVCGNLGFLFAILYFVAAVAVGKEIGTVVSVILLLAGVRDPVGSVAGLIAAKKVRAVGTERLRELCAGERSSCCPIRMNDFDEIVFDGVGFSYGNKEVLRSVSFRIRRGEKVCFTGRSGEGKSTLFDLLIGIADPGEGEVKIFEGGSFYLPKETDGLFALVPQTVRLPAGTIRANVTCFGRDVTEEEIAEAIGICSAEFIFDLPRGIDSEIGEGGANLSEGQCQRLALMRALLSRRPILMLDEATSALDPETEEKVLRAVTSLPGKTCIMISHRETALRYSDREYRLKDGAITEIAKESI